MICLVLMMRLSLLRVCQPPTVVIHEFFCESRSLLILGVFTLRTIRDQLHRWLATEWCHSGARAKLIHYLVYVFSRVEVRCWTDWWFQAQFRHSFLKLNMLVYLSLIDGNFPLPVFALSAALTVIMTDLLPSWLRFLIGSLASDIKHWLTANCGGIALVS